MNRIEWLAGYRWAKDVCFEAGALLKTEGGHARLMDMLSRGLIEKPASYAAGVQQIIKIVDEVKP